MTDQSQATIAEERPVIQPGSRERLAQDYLEACFESLKARCAAATKLPFIPEVMDEWLESLPTTGPDARQIHFDDVMSEVGWSGAELRALLFPKMGYDSERIFAREFNLFLRERGVTTRFGTSGTHLRIL